MKEADLVQSKHQRLPDGRYLITIPVSLYHARHWTEKELVKRVSKALFGTAKNLTPVYASPLARLAKPTEQEGWVFRNCIISQLLGPSKAARGGVCYYFNLEIPPFKTGDQETKAAAWAIVLGDLFLEGS